MNILDSPLEALAINYLSDGVLTAINNVWTLIAVFAAVSFWKLRANSLSVSTISDHHLHHTTFLPPKAKQCSISQPPPAAIVSSVSETAAVMRPESRIVEWFHDESTRGKFTAYYGGEEVVVEEENGDGNCDDDEVDSGMWRHEDGWEAVLRMKTQELGWYRYQDLTVLDGNVVRLWDGCGRRNGYGLSGNVW